jgi:hypothetical protein
MRSIVSGGLFAYITETNICNENFDRPASMVYSVRYMLAIGLGRRYSFSYPLAHFVAV